MVHTRQSSGSQIWSESEIKIESTYGSGGWLLVAPVPSGRGGRGCRTIPPCRIVPTTSTSSSRSTVPTRVLRRTHMNTEPGSQHGPARRRPSDALILTISRVTHQALHSNQSICPKTTPISSASPLRPMLSIRVCVPVPLRPLPPLACPRAPRRQSPHYPAAAHT